MKDKIEAAVGSFREGFNCSQAILSTYSGEFGLEREAALKAAAAFGGGMGGLGEVCGAVTGALFVIGLKYGYTEAKDKETKEKTYARVRDFAGRFRSRHGALCCRELAGLRSYDGGGSGDGAAEGIVHRTLSPVRPVGC